MSSDWVQSEKYLSKEFRFKSFTDAMAFMVRISFDAEKMNHHPEWKNIYNKVYVELTTHDTGCVTEKDHALAKAMDAAYSKYT